MRLRKQEKRKKWRQKLLQATDQKMAELHLDPVIVDVFKEGIRGALKGPYYRVQSSEYQSEPLQTAIQSQNAIGWVDFLSGSVARWIYQSTGKKITKASG